ncbi:hypothetical protein M0804_014739 [Polistes exclamans]|nr:hypothetical protein M0804_014741 [Polistes exclamans]KAI4474657.1 hypothetical protein M0804_014739 [Polistes exclamans]
MGKTPLCTDAAGPVAGGAVADKYVTGQHHGVADYGEPRHCIPRHHHHHHHLLHNHHHHHLLLLKEREKEGWLVGWVSDGNGRDLARNSGASQGIARKKLLLLLLLLANAAGPRCLFGYMPLRES